METIEFIGVVLKGYYQHDEPARNASGFSCIIESLACPSEMQTATGWFVIGTHKQICAN